jgi:hypothetical protein
MGLKRLAATNTLAYFGSESMAIKVYNIERKVYKMAPFSAKFLG